jgi:hypothetical protein
MDILNLLYLFTDNKCWDIMFDSDWSKAMFLLALWWIQAYVFVCLLDIFQRLTLSTTKQSTFFMCMIISLFYYYPLKNGVCH